MSTISDIAWELIQRLSVNAEDRRYVRQALRDAKNIGYTSGHTHGWDDGYEKAKEDFEKGETP